MYWLIGFNCAPLPLERLIIGCLLKFKTSDDPYDEPLDVTWTEVIPPLNIGCAWAWYNESDTPVFPVMFTDISG